MDEKEYLPEEPEQFDRDEVFSRLEKLIDACRDAEAGYLDAAEHTTNNPELRSFFVEQSHERARFADDLRAEMHRLGKWETTREGSVLGTLERTWFDLKRLVGQDEGAIFEGIAAGEAHAKALYEDVLARPLPPETAGIVRSQAQSVFAAHDHAQALLKRRSAA